MSVYKRGGSWTYHVAVMVNGKREQHKRGGFATKDEALRAERAKLSEVDGGMRLGAARMTCGDYLQGWLVRYSRAGAVKRGTVVTTSYQVRVHLLPRIGEIPLGKLTRAHVEALAGDLLQDGRVATTGGDGLSPKSVRNVMATLHKALGDAVKNGLLPYNPASDVTLPKIERTETVTWSLQQVEAFLADCEAQRDLLTAAWALALTCGLRRGELCGLRWSDVDLVKGKLLVRQTRLQNRTGVYQDSPKSREALRKVTLTAPAINALARLSDDCEAMQRELGSFGHDYVLVMPDDGRPVQPQYLARHWHKAIKRANANGLQRAGIELPMMRLHDARHTHFTNLAELGVPLHAIRARAGHASIVTTETFYVHATEAADERAALTLDDVLGQVGSSLVANPARKSELRG